MAWAEISSLLNYQGRLTDSGGKPVQGALTITFRIYDAATGGSKKWEETQTFNLTTDDEGIFNAILGSVTSLSAVDFNGSLWLSIQVSGDTEMSPRQRLTAVGAALNAAKLNSLDATSFLRTDVDTATSGKLTITRSGAALLIKPTTAPAADTKLIDVQNAAGTSKFSVDIEGDTAVAGDLTVSGALNLTGAITASNAVVTNPSSAQAIQPSSDVVPLTLKGKASGSAKVLSVYDAASTPAEIAFFDSTGQLKLAKSPGTTSPALLISAEASPSFSTSTATQLVLSQASGGSSNLLDGQIGGTSKFKVDASGNVTIAGTMSTTGTTTFTSDLTLNAQADLRLADSDSSNWVAFQAPATITSNVTWTLPSADGSANQVLTTDGSGTLAWATAGSISGVGDITSVTAGTGLTGGGASGDVTLTLSTPVSVANGGTGAATAAAARSALGAAASGANSDITSLTGLTTPLSVAQGGTGAVTLTANGVLYGAGTSAMSATSAGTTNTVLHGNTGSAPSFSAVSLTADVSGTLPLANGGTNAALSNCTSGQALTVTSGVAACTSTLTASDAGSSTTNSTFTVNSGNAGAAADGSGFIIKGTTNKSLLWDGTNSRMAFNDDVVIDSATYQASPAQGGLFIAQDPTASDSDGYIFLGRRSAQTGGWNFLQGKSNGELYWDGSEVKVKGSSPARLTFGSSTSEVSLIYDPSTDSIWFSRGTFAQQFRNLVKNGSFEAFSGISNYRYNTSATCPSGATCPTTGSTQGGWNNFAPDEWLWEAGQVFQTSPVGYGQVTDSNVTATNLQQDFYHGKSAVTLQDTNVSATDGPYDATKDASASYSGVNDAHIEHTVTGLKPSTVYSVGVYMRRVNSTAEAVVDLTGEATTPDASTTPAPTLASALAADVKKMAVNSWANFPNNGIVIVSGERISYTGKESPNLLTGLIRGFEGTTAATGTVASGTAVTFAPFKHLTTGTGAANDFAIYRGQFVTTSKADDVKLHLICVGSASSPAPQCRFDAVQVVEGRSVPEFQPGAIVDTGDQTLYGTLRMGRTSDGRGGILAVDQAIRTKQIEFFEKDPGITGTAGGGGSISQPARMPTTASQSALTATTSGTYTGLWKQFLITALSSTTFKVEARPCTASPCSGSYASIGADNLTIVNNGDYHTTAAIIPGSGGVALKFSASSGLVATNDQWTFEAHGSTFMAASTYNSLTGAVAFQPGNTRIYTVKDTATGQSKLYFQDDTGPSVSLEAIRGAGATGLAHVDVITTAGNTNKLALTIPNQGFTGGSQVTFDVQVCSALGASGRNQFQWRDNVQNGGQSNAYGWDSSCVEIPANGGPYGPLTIGAPENTNYGFTISFTSQAGTWADGTSGDAWQLKAYPASTSTTVKTSDTGTVTSLMIQDGGVGTLDLANGAVTGAKIAMGSDAKGDVLVHNGTAYVRLPVGSNTQVLAADSTTATGLKWTTAAVSDNFTVKSSSSDSTSNYLATELTAGTGISVAETGSGDTKTQVAIDTTVVPRLSVTNTFTATTASPILIKPSSAPAANTKLFDMQATGAGTTNFSVDAEGDVLANSLTLTTALAVGQGGTGLTSYTTGDVPYASATNTLSALAGNTTTTRKFLAQTGTGSASAAPAWGTLAVSDLPTHTHPAADITSGALANTRGGTGQDSSAWSGVATISSGTWAATATTGTGSVVLASSPTLVTPSLGVATATTLNKVTLTAPATSATLTLADGKTFTVNNSLTLAGTDGTTMTFPATSDTVVTLGATQTLTNKTVSSPVVTGDVLAHTGSYLSPYGGIGRYENLCLRSEDQTTTWADATATAVTVSADLAAANPAPNGTTTADRLTQASSTIGAGRKQDISVSTAAGDRTFTFSVWLKAATAHTARVQLVTATNTQTLQSLTVTTAWQRFSTIYAVPTGDTNTTLTVKLFLDDGATYNSLDVWGAQLEENATPGVYVRTTGSAMAASRGAVTDGVATGTTSGTVTSVASGTGLTGGPVTTSGTLNVDVGTTANKIVQLNGSAQLPAVSGALLTNLDAGNIAAGTLAIARGGTGAAPGADDQVLIADSTSAATWRALPDCANATTSKLLYTAATNTWSCGTDQTSAGSGYATIQEEGTGLTARTTLNFIGSAITAADNAGSSRTDVTLAQANLVGTTNQINLSASGTGVLVGSTNITLSLPQNINTAATPQFARMGLGAAADATHIFTATSASTTDRSAVLSVSHTGVITGTGYAGSFSTTGGSTTNVGLYATASGATNNYAAIFDAGNVGFGTASPTNLLSLGGDSARTVWMERHTLADRTGNNLTIQAGGATSGATDKAGGDLVLKSGVATGTGTSKMTFQTHPAGSTGTTDTTATTAMTILGSGNLGLGTTSPSYLLSLGGDAARTVGMERHTTANTAGNALTLLAGGATSGATDKAGGDLILAPGTSTGTGKSKVQLQSAIAGATGTTDRAPAAHLQVSQGHLVSLGTAPTVSSCGTSPTIVGTDISGKVTIGTGTVTSCTVTFATAYDTNAPACTVGITVATITMGVSTSTTALTITSSASMASRVVTYLCIGKE